MTTAYNENEHKFALYATEGNDARFFLRLHEGTAWLTRMEIAELFQTTKQNVSRHISQVLAESELMAHLVVKEDLTTADDGRRYCTRLYNLDLILAVGYRVRSPRGTWFRQWATTILKGAPTKDFDSDDDRICEPSFAGDVYDMLRGLKKPYDSEWRRMEAVKANSEALKALERAKQEFTNKGENDAAS